MCAAVHPAAGRTEPSAHTTARIHFVEATPAVARPHHTPGGAEPRAKVPPPFIQREEHRQKLPVLFV